MDSVPPCCGTYLVTIAYTHKCGKHVNIVKEANYDIKSNRFTINSNDSTYDGTGDIKSSKFFDSKITAWTFMPEPYKEEQA